MTVTFSTFAPEIIMIMLPSTTSDIQFPKLKLQGDSPWNIQTGQMMSKDVERKV